MNATNDYVNFITSCIELKLAYFSYKPFAGGFNGGLLELVGLMIFLGLLFSLPPIFIFTFSSTSQSWMAISEATMANN